MFTRTVVTEIEISSDSQHVWNILTDFENYPAWNPFIVQISGPILPGHKITATMKLEGSKPMTFTPTISKAISGSEFRWQGRLWLRGIMDAEHRFCLESISATHVRFIHSEQFNGVLTPLIMLMIGRKTMAGFAAMNIALKQMAEHERQAI